MARLSLSLLGPFQVSLGAKPVTGLESNKVRALLAYLVVEADRPHRRDALAALLWPNRADTTARTNLRNALSNLRRAIKDPDAQEPFLLISRDTVQFNLASDQWVDVTAFGACVATGDKEAGDAHDRRPAQEYLARAVAHYRGSFLEGFSLKGCLAFDDWSLVVRERLQRQALSALTRLAQDYEQQGDTGRALEATRRQVEMEPWQEPAHRRLMRLLALDGQRAEALAQYERCRRILRQELSVEPEPETAALYERIRDGAEVPAPEASPPHNLPAQLTPFVGREEALAEIKARLRDPACRLLTLVGPGGSGKTRLALEAAAAQLGDFEDGVFFVSLAPLRSVESIEPTVATALGLRGAGNPREQLLGYLKEKNLLLILDNVEHLLPPSPPKSPPMGGSTTFVIDILRTAPHVKILVTSRAELKVQGEHRFPVGGMSFPRLAVESIDNPDQYSALNLFSGSARRAEPDFELADDNLMDVVRICHLVSGMPLGILMAAAWVKMLSPGEVADEISRSLDFLEADLSDVPERQRSMRAVFDHSWGLLTERQRTIFQALSVFRGSFTREATEQVTGASLRELKGLVDRSLVQRAPAPSTPLRTGGRYEMHELLRQYATQSLENSPDGGEAVGDRHCAYYIGVLERWEPGQKGARQTALLAEMRLDIENARAAWDWAAARAQADRLGRAVGGLGYYYLNRAGGYKECEAACRAAANRLEAEVFADESVPSKAEGLRVLARILGWQSRSTLFLGNSELGTQLALQGLALLERPELAGLDTRREKALILQWGALAMAPCPERSRQLWRQALSLWRALGDHFGTAQTLYLAGFASLWFGHPEDAEPLLRESVAVCQRSGHRTMAAHGLRDLAMAFLLSGQFERARSLLEERLANYDDLGGIPESAQRYWLLGLAHMHLGDYQQARALGQTGLALFRQTTSWWMIGLSLALLACVALADAEDLTSAAILPGTTDGGEARKGYTEALRMAQESIAISREDDWQHAKATALPVLGLAAHGLDRREQAKQRLYESLQASFEIGVFQWTVLPLSAIAILLADVGEHERAVEVYALAYRYPLVANSRWFEDVFGPHIEEVAAALPPEVVAAARERGRARDLEATVKELLAELEA